MPFNADGSFTEPAGSTNAFSGQTIASATWNAINTDVQSALSHSAGLRAFALRTVNFQQTGVDVAISVTVPTARYRIDQVVITNLSATLVAAGVSLYTGAAQAGVAIAVSQSFPSLSVSTSDTANNMAVMVLNSVSIVAFNDATLQFRLVNPSGGAATADVILYVRPL